jgi:Spx/MgsR family transcriptional regulator
MKFLQKPTCTTCRKARALLEKLGADLQFRSFDAEPLDVGELDRLIGSRDYRQFLNTRNQLYRQRGMKLHPPARAEAIRLMSKHPNLIRRPVVIQGDEIVLGYDEAAFRKLVNTVSRNSKSDVR